MKRHLVAACLALGAVPAWATWTSPASAQQAPAVGDEVKLKDGSVFRGTITELVAKDHVDLLMPSGQTRRFKLADVAYAGPVGRPPVGPPEPAPGVRADSVDVHVASDQADVQLLVRTGQAQGAAWGYRGSISIESREYGIVCTAPCDAQLPAGLQRLALSHHGGSAVEADDPVDLRPRSTLQAHYESRAGVRIAGYVIGTAGVITGVVLILTSFDYGCNGVPGCQVVQNEGQLIGGIVVFIASAIVGGILSGIPDHADIQLVSQAASRWMQVPGTTEAVGAAPVDGMGMALRVRF
jgi:hypothetical protein